MKIKTDLSGTNEGIVKLWHWGSNEPLSSCKQGDKSYSAKITKLQFNTHGNKVFSSSYLFLNTNYT